MNLQSRVLLFVMKPLITGIIGDIIKNKLTDAYLIQLREKVLNEVLSFTEKTSFSWDDRFAKKLYNSMINGGMAREMAEKMLDCAEGWVKDSQTKWDDEIVIPAITSFRAVIQSNFNH